jgi:2-polyprenyl-6-methoxyphenol hydroxylase-like FAD-dependent oxidoreductase
MTEVLVVGAGPTGLALAAHLVARGVHPRVVDRAPDRVHESRALAIQPRTLEVLAPLGLSDELVALGNPGVRLTLHSRGREADLRLFDLGLEDTEFPFLLFLSQAETERVLGEWLAQRGVRVERGVSLTGLHGDGDGASARLRHADGTDETAPARFVVGCDGGRSAVRDAAGIAFQGSSYPQSFLLADLEVDGIAPDAVHVFLSRSGMLFYFPLGQPASWRLLAMEDPAAASPESAPVTRDDLQAISDAYTGGGVRLHDPVWATRFRLHHRIAAHYRQQSVFLAGDAAHVHSPAGAQGMNTGIQDAANLAWKLAQVVQHGSNDALLDTYDLERRPVGRSVLRFSDRGLRISTSTNPVLGFIRTRVAPRALSMATRWRAGRAYGFRTIAQLNIHYRRSPLSVDGPAAKGRAVRAGDRLPDVPLDVDGGAARLHTLIDGTGWNLLLFGPRSAWADVPAVPGVAVHRVSTATMPGVLVDRDGSAVRRFGLSSDDVHQVLVRPDGHIGYRGGGADVAGLHDYLRRWVRA